MKLTAHYASQDWQFELVSIGGKQANTRTTGDAMFASSLVVSLDSDIPSMTDLYVLLYHLTRQAWHGYIPINPSYLEQDYHPTLVGWNVRKPTEGESGKYICQIDYQVFMPHFEIEYSLGENDVNR
jgi:hypothetical protein